MGHIISPPQLRASSQNTIDKNEVLHRSRAWPSWLFHTQRKLCTILLRRGKSAIQSAQSRYKKEMTKRERCHPVGPKPLCKKVEDEEHEVVVTKETCRVGTGSTGPLCKKEVLKREKCHPTGMKPLCRRVVETEYEEVVTREMCPPLLSGKSGCKRISQEKRGCKPGPGKPYCS